MKKQILSAVLILISLNGTLHAQKGFSKVRTRSNTENTFNINHGFTNIRDFVTLKEGEMILDLSDQTDFESFRNLDSILVVFKKDIAFYKDSLAADPTAHYRIDYIINPDYNFKKIRFKKYAADGDIFMTQNGEVSKLKYEQDTIHIIVHRSKPGFSRKSNPCMIPYKIQATFLLGNYYDIDRIVADHILKDVIDTLEKTSVPGKVKKSYFQNPVTVIYNPYYDGNERFRKTDRILDDERSLSPILKKTKFFSINASIGAAMVRNTLSPMGDLGIQYNRYVFRDNTSHNIFRLSVAPYYFFSKSSDGSYKVCDNWFVNGELGSRYSHNVPGWFGKTCTLGAGYLFSEKGGYFKNTTCKVFTDLQVTSWITIVPEMIFTDDFKQIFPGITVKVF